MIYNINDKICKSKGLALEELFALLLVKICTDIPKLFKDLEDKNIVVKDMFKGYMLTQRWDDVVSTILLDSDKKAQPDARIEHLATSLMEIFPAGKKVGTCHYFKGNKKDISLRLKKFFKLYGSQFTDEQILQAARSYVASYNGDYRYMRILKYFIWKDIRREDGEGVGYTDETSDLASWIENKSSEAHNNNWNVELR